MEVISNIDRLLGDNLKTAICKNAKISIAAPCFSICAYEQSSKKRAASVPLSLQTRQRRESNYCCSLKNM